MGCICHLLCCALPALMGLVSLLGSRKGVLQRQAALSRNPLVRMCMPWQYWPYVSPSANGGMWWGKGDPAQTLLFLFQLLAPAPLTTPIGGFPAIGFSFNTLPPPQFPPATQPAAHLCTTYPSSSAMRRLSDSTVSQWPRCSPFLGFAIFSNSFYLGCPCKGTGPKKERKSLLPPNPSSLAIEK